MDAGRGRRSGLFSLVTFAFPAFCFSQDNFGFDLQAVEAATKKHEAIETDIAAYEERVQAVVAVARELEVEHYHDIKRITARKDNVIRLWEYLLELLKARRLRLEMNLGLQRVFQEMLYIMDWMDEMKVLTKRLIIRNYIIQGLDRADERRILWSGFSSWFFVQTRNYSD